MKPVFKILRARLTTEVEPHPSRETSVEFLHAIGLVASNALYNIRPIAVNRRFFFGRFGSFNDDFQNIVMPPKVSSWPGAGLNGAHWIVSPCTKAHFD
jgi:hypothetical protein